jgi:putative inorganic carbon (HCO3(-)) transporter
MRDILVVSIVAVAAIMALRRPWIGVMLWTWLSIMSPHRYTWGFANDAPLAAIAAVFTLIGLLMTSERKSPFKGAPANILALFVIWMTLSWVFGIDIMGDYQQWNKVIKIYFMSFIALALLHTKHHIMAFTWVTVGSLAILGAKGGLFTILSGGSYRVYGPPGSFIEENNAFGLALIIIIPLLYFLFLQATNKLVRQGLLLVIILCAASALGSHSRGALLAIAAMGAMFWWRSTKKVPAMILIAIVMLVLLPMMPETWWARMNTIENYQVDASAQGRLLGWRIATEVAKHYFFGAGMGYQHQFLFSQYGEAGDRVIAAHSIYFQILGNHGFIGLFIFIGIWISTYRYAGWLRKNAATIPEARWAADLGSMVQVGLVAYLVGGAFLSLAYFDLPYSMLIMVVLARKWVENRAWESEPAIPFLEYAGLRRKKVKPTSSVVQSPDSGSG